MTNTSNSIYSIQNLFYSTDYQLDENTMIKILNIWDQYKVNERLQQDSAYYDFYNVTDYDRWDSIALRFYGDVNLFWLLPIYNDIIDPFTFFDNVGKSSETITLKILKREYLQNLIYDLARFTREMELKNK